MNVLTLILAGGQGSRLSILGEKRAKPAVPFAGKYRIIDFPLSNAVNSGLYRVAVLTQYRPHSLMQHIGIGEPWDLNRRQPNGVQIWQPYRGRKDQDWYRGTADALYQNRNFIAEMRAATRVLVLSGDHIYKQDYRDLLRFHEAKGADLTVAVMNVPPDEVFRFGIMSTDATSASPSSPRNPSSRIARWRPWGSMSSTRDFLLQQLKRTPRIRARPTTSARTSSRRWWATTSVFAYPFSGYWVDVGTISGVLGDQPGAVGREAGARSVRPELGDPHAFGRAPPGEAGAAGESRDSLLPTAA